MHSILFSVILRKPTPIFVLHKRHFAFDNLDLSWSPSSCIVYRELQFGVSNKSFISVSVSFCDFCPT